MRSNKNVRDLPEPDEKSGVHPRVSLAEDARRATKSRLAIVGAAHDRDVEFIAMLHDLSRALVPALRGHRGRTFDNADLAQQILISLVRRRAASAEFSWRSARDLRAFAIRAAGRRASDARRGERRCQSRENEWALFDDAHAYGPEDLCALRETVLFCREIIARLPVELSEVVVARWIAELSIAETATKLRIPESMVKSRLLRARRTLKRLFSRAGFSAAKPPSKNTRQRRHEK